jgi:hypothetical protein
MKNNSKPNRDFLTLHDKLETEFAIVRNWLEDEEMSFPVSQMIGEYVDLYRQLVGRRIVARESLIHKSNDQAVEDEIQHLRQTIAPLVGCDPKMITPEDRFCEIVPVKDQHKVWTNIFADFPGLIIWEGKFFVISLVILFFASFLGIVPISGEIAKVFGISRTIVIGIGAICGFIVLLLIILLQIFYYSRRWAYQALTLRQIAQKIVNAKEEYIDYPIRSVDEVEPLLLKTLSECFDIPLNSLKLETRLDTDLGFEF